MKNIKGCLLHNSDDWKTPHIIYDHVINKLGFIDCFQYKTNNNEFLNDYKHQHLYINPPFSKLDKVVDWIIRQYYLDNEIILLMPSRTDTKYFHKLLDFCSCDIYFIKGRLHFNDSEKCAPFPTMFVLICKDCESNFCGVTLEQFLQCMSVIYE